MPKISGNLIKDEIYISFPFKIFEKITFEKYS